MSDCNTSFSSPLYSAFLFFSPNEFKVSNNLHYRSQISLSHNKSNHFENFPLTKPILLLSLINCSTIFSSSATSVCLVSLQCCTCWPVFPPQIAVSHTTACGLWQGGVPVLRGSGVRLQLGRMGMLSCLHRLLSGRLWALISLHRQRLRSMTSSSLPSLWVCVADWVVPPLTGGCPCASWASCWNCN